MRTRVRVVVSALGLLFGIRRVARNAALELATFRRSREGTLAARSVRTRMGMAALEHTADGARRHFRESTARSGARTNCASSTSTSHVACR